MTTKHTLCVSLVLLAGAALIGCNGDKVEATSHGWKKPFHAIRDSVTRDKERPDPDLCVVDFDRAYLDARTALLQGVSDQDPYIRAHAIEAIGNVLGGQYSSSLIQGLNDKATLVRFASAMACGKNAVAGAKGRLLQLVQSRDADDRVVSASLYALSRIGNTRYAPRLGTLVACPCGLFLEVLADGKNSLREPPCGSAPQKPQGSRSPRPLRRALRALSHGLETVVRCAEQPDVRALQRRTSVFQLDNVIDEHASLCTTAVRRLASSTCLASNAVA